MKPDNILISSDGHIKLTDFGLSKQLERSKNGSVEYDAASNSFCGSTAYMTPEMLKRQPHGKSIDWYGVGALIYECIVSIPPYFNVEVEVLNKNILEGPLKIPEVLFSREC